LHEAIACAIEQGMSLSNGSTQIPRTLAIFYGSIPQRAERAVRAR